MTRILRPAAWATGTAVAPLSTRRAVSATNEGTAQPAATRVAPRVRKLRRDIEEVSAGTALLRIVPLSAPEWGLGATGRRGPRGRHSTGMKGPRGRSRRSISVELVG